MRALASADQGQTAPGRPYAHPATEYRADADDHRGFAYRLEALATLSVFALTLSYLSGAARMIGALISTAVS
ncbi:hypothetical protein [Prosthecomicrobium pneumaticum]|uniref:Uncharacterized protein n=1 Tax=Prosthecomicrobium pneumaticum TaxID=81895 RepID=A0A7W9FNP0_9HYPH|nr:hypothetical protein [Prosthecomicrobium pneumaticum]MBB5754004.1 hypothetical protein [Prosthecomicrobium pneumaticum]